MRKFLSLMVAFMMISLAVLPQGVFAASISDGNAILLSADSSGVEVQMYNGSTASSTNMISPKFKVLNKGTSSVDLSSLTVRYYYTVEGSATQTVSIDNCAITPKNGGYTPVSAKGTVVKMTKPATKSDSYAEFSFASGTLASGDTLEIQTRINKSDWSNYDQSNDYSFNSSASQYATSINTPAYVTGGKVFGTEPDENGGSSNGGTSNGGTSNGGTSNGGTSNGGTSNGGTSNGGTSNGGTSNGGQTFNKTTLAVDNVAFKAVGDTITVPVKLVKIPSNGLMSVEATVKFDSAALQLVSAEAGPVVKNATNNFTATTGTDNVALIFMDEEVGPNKITSDGVFANLTFKVLANKSSTISISNVILADGDIKAVSAETASGTISGNGGSSNGGTSNGGTSNGGTSNGGSSNGGGFTKPTVDAVDATYKAVGDTVTVPVKLVKVPSNGLMSVEATVKYDSSALQYVSAEAGSILKNAANNFTVTPGTGSISLVFMDEEVGPNKITSDGVFANLTFKVLADKTSTISISDVILADGDIAAVNAATDNGVVSSGGGSSNGGSSNGGSSNGGSSNGGSSNGGSSNGGIITGYTVVLGSTAAESGSVATVPVSLKNVPAAGLAGVQFTVQVDSAYVDSIAYEAGAACTNPSKNLSVTISGNKAQILFIDDTMGDQLIKTDGVLVNLKLTLKAGAKGTTTVKVSDVGTSSDVDFNTYTPATIDSILTIGNGGSSNGGSSNGGSSNGGSSNGGSSNGGSSNGGSSNGGIITGYTVVLGSTDAEIGSVATVPVSLKNVPAAGLAGVQFTVQVDSAYVDSIDYEAGAACTNPSKNLSVTISGNKAQVLFIDDTMGDQLIKNDGVLVNLKLKLKAGAKGTTTVKVSDVGTSSDVDFNTYTPATIDSILTIGNGGSSNGGSSNGGSSNGGTSNGGSSNGGGFTKPTVDAVDATYKAVGDTVTVPVKLVKVPSNGLMSVEATVKYDSSVLQYVSAEAGSILKNAANNFTVTPGTESVSLVFMDEEVGPNKITSDGVFANVTFKVLADKTSTIKISDVILADGDIAAVEAGTDNGTVSNGGGSSNGGTSNGGTSNGGTSNGGSSNGGGFTKPTVDAVDATYKAVGDTVTVPVKLVKVPSNGLMSVEATVKYDSSVLQYVSAEAGSILKNAANNFTVTPGTGCVTLVFMDEEVGPNKITSDGVYANITFKVLADKTSTITISDVTLADGDIAAVDAGTDNGIVSSNGGSSNGGSSNGGSSNGGSSNGGGFTKPTVDAVDATYKAVGDTITVPVKLVKVPSNGLMSVEATVKYDSSALQYVSAEAGSILKNAANNFTITPGTGSVTLVFMDEEVGPNKITSDGVYANVTFKVLADKTSTITISDVTLADGDIAAVEAGTDNGTVSKGSIITTDIITPSKIVFDMSNPADVTIKLADGETLADIKAGAASLTKGNDYIVSGNTIKIAKSYYQYIFGKWPLVTNVLTFTTVSGKTGTLSATATLSPTKLITPEKVEFDLNSASGVDITIASTETLSDIKAGTASLTKGTDYTISGNKVTINGYFRYIFTKWPDVTCNLTFNFASGKSAVLSATKKKTSVSLITPNKVEFDLSSPNGVDITIASGKTLSDIKAGTASLTKGTDYTVSGNKVTINGYFRYIFTKWPAVTCSLTFVMTSGETAVLTATKKSTTDLITPKTIVFDMKNPADVTVTLASGETLADIKAGTASLTKGNDYIVSGNTIKIAKSYYQYIFGKWPLVTNVLTFTTVSGKTGTLSATAKSGGTTILDSAIAPTALTITKGQAADQSVALTLNGNTLSSITGLVAGTDYTLSGSTVVLKASYLNKLTADTTLTFNFSAGNAQKLAVTVKSGDPEITKYTVVLGSASAASGSVVTVPVSLKKIPAAGLAGVQFTVQVDSAYVDSIAYEAGAACTNPSKNLSVTVSGNRAQILFIDDTMGDQVLKTDGVLVNLKLTLKAGAKGTTTVKVSDVGTSSDVDFNTYTPATIDSTLAIK